jgi:hypothetical protein
MDEQFDDNLKNHIKEVFENFEDTSADEGWLLLRKKFPAGQARRPLVWLWWGAAAAVLLIFLGIGLWINSGTRQSEKRIVKTINHAQPTNLATNKTHRDTLDKVTTNKENLAKATIKANPAINSNGFKTFGQVKKLAQPALLTKSSLKDTSIKNSVIAKTVNNDKNINNQVPVQQLATAGKPTAAASQQPGTKVPDQQLVTAAQTPSVNSSIIKKQPPAKSINSMFAEDKVVKSPEDEKLKIDTKRVRFSVYAATYFNYAKGSNNQVNEGLGVTTDLRITKNLKFVTGIAIAQNTLNFSSTAPPVTAQYEYAAAATSVIPQALNVNNYAVPTLKNYDASLVGLDIPLNLKYEFNPQKNDTYVLAGLSSGTFINQTYTSQYNYPNSFSSQQTQDVITHSSANSFYFAKTLNVAFGVGYPLGKNRLVIEPFLKYPLQGLGSQDIRFGSGGLNLKFNFEKKRE